MGTDPLAGAGPRALVCWEWAVRFAAHSGDLQQITGVMMGLLLGIALAHEDREWARAAAQELTDLLGRVGETTSEQQRLVTWEEARLLIARARALGANEPSDA